jgi:hypothetical protein
LLLVDRRLVSGFLQFFLSIRGQRVSDWASQGPGAAATPRSDFAIMRALAVAGAVDELQLQWEREREWI